MSDREWPDDWPLAAIRFIEKQGDEIERLRSLCDSLADDVDRLLVQRGLGNTAIREAEEWRKEVERLNREVANRAHFEQELMKERDKLRALVVRAAEFCDYSDTSSEGLEYGIRCCCGTRDYKAHREDCEFGKEALGHV